jgi:hypothetical protein
LFIIHLRLAPWATFYRCSAAKTVGKSGCVSSSWNEVRENWKGIRVFVSAVRVNEVRVTFSPKRHRAVMGCWAYLNPISTRSSPCQRVQSFQRKNIAASEEEARDLFA